MVIKWKKYKKRIYQILLVCMVIIASLLSGMIMNDYLNWHYFCLLFLSFIIAESAGILLIYQLLDERWKSVDYKRYILNLKKAFRIQHLIIGAYIMIAAVILLLPRGDYNYNNIFTLQGELSLYRLSWITNIILIGIPLFSECLILFNYFSRRNPYDKELSQLAFLIEQIQEGNHQIENPFQKESIFYSYGETLSNITEITQLAVEKQIRSEKLKVDLISNVSHDLKTPLTSIISYLDLLQKEELSAEASDYVEILAKRSQKLKEMIESLFDLAKTTSGNANLKMEQMDLNRLVEQILADTQDKIQASGKQIKYNISAKPLPFIADSGYLYRVCQNLFDNAMKYSLQGTRIFIETIEDNDQVILKVINTACYEMNFTEESIVERFSRGDEARSTEGNGLGLAIAKSYTEACKGDFHIKVEGDQFKAEIRFAKVL